MRQDPVMPGSLTMGVWEQIRAGGVDAAGAGGAECVVGGSDGGQDASAAVAELGYSHEDDDSSWDPTCALAGIEDTTDA